MDSGLKWKFMRILNSEAVSSLDNDLQQLIPDFCEAVLRGNPRELKEVFDQGFSVNFPIHGGTALHYFAAHYARPAIRVLLNYEDVDFLARDYEGSLSSELAYVYSRDPALARLLGIKERKQADAQGIKLTRRPPPEPKP